MSWTSKWRMFSVRRRFPDHRKASGRISSKVSPFLSARENIQSSP